MNIRMIRKMFVGKELVEDNIMKVDTVVNYDKRNDRGIIIIRFQGADGDILSTAELVVSKDIIFTIKPLKCAWQYFSSPRRVEYKRAYATEARYNEYYNVLKEIIK